MNIERRLRILIKKMINLKTLYIIVAIIISFMLGRLTKTSTTYYNSNIDLVMESIQVTDRCLAGWKNTIQLLKDANEIIKIEND